MHKLINKVNNPRKYDHFIDMPGEFDAAEQLISHWDELNVTTKRKIVHILVRSGLYVA